MSYIALQSKAAMKRGAMEATAQMNVRIDPELKKAGDRVLELRGITPSQAVRALYRSLIGGGDRAEQAIEVVTESSPTEEERQAETDRVLQGIKDVQDSIKAFYEQIGYTGPKEGEPQLSDKELLAQAKWEQMLEKGMVRA